LTTFRASGALTPASIFLLTYNRGSASLKNMKENFACIIFRELMDSADGWGHDEGREVFARLLTRVEANPGKKIFRISLKGVERTDTSFPRESLMELARRYRGDKGFCIYDAISKDLLDNWDAAALKKNQPIFVWGSEHYHIIGPDLKKGNASILDYALSRDQVRAIDAVKDLGLGLSNASSKLKQLWEKGYLLRSEEVAESGGIEYVYFKIK
jgi:hypothetical protein